MRTELRCSKREHCWHQSRVVNLDMTMTYTRQQQQQPPPGSSRAAGCGKVAHHRSFSGPVRCSRSLARPTLAIRATLRSDAAASVNSYKSMRNGPRLVNASPERHRGRRRSNPDNRSSLNFCSLAIDLSRNCPSAHIA